MKFSLCIKISVIALALFSSAHIPVSMASPQTSLAEVFERFQNERPNKKYVSVNSESADLVLSSIATIYSQTTKITDTYINKVNAHGSFAQLVASRDGVGEEAYQEAVESLSDKEKSEYTEYLSSNDAILAESIKLIPELRNLHKGIRDIDPKDLTSNPLRLFSIIVAINHAKDQLVFTTNALRLLESHHSATRSARNNLGR